MKNATARLFLFSLILLVCLGTASAQIDTFVRSGETLTVGTGESLLRTVVFPNATLILDGGSITHSPIYVMDSIEITAGGLCIMMDGVTDYIENNGRLELYGGTAGAVDSSVNRGYIKMAGGDIGFQIIQFGGVIDIFYPAATRTNLEVNCGNSTPPDAVRLFTLTNSLGYGQFDVSQLGPPARVYPGGGEYEVDCTFWSPDGDVESTIVLNIPTNWTGSLLCEPVTVPASTSIVCMIDSAVDLTWGSLSNRGYQVQTTTNLLSDVWEDLGTPVYNTQFGNLYFDEANEAIKAYRAKVVH